MLSFTHTSLLPDFELNPEAHRSLRRKKSDGQARPEIQPGAFRRFLRFLGRQARRIGPEPLAWKSEAHLFALAVLSALLMRLPFPRIDLASVAAVGLVPFLWALPRATSGKQVFYLGWVFGAVYYYVQLFWLHILTQYSVMIIPGLITLGIYLGLFKALFAWLVWRFGTRGRLGFLLAATAWVSFEYLQSIGDLGFPWGYLGHTLWMHPSLIQLSAWTGVYGLSLVLFWSNHLLADLIRRMRRESGAPAGGELIARAVVLGLFGALVALSASAGRRTVAAEDFYTSGPATIGIVQPNIPQQMKLKSYAYDTPREEKQRLQTDILIKTIRLSHGLRATTGTAPCDLIVWPETAVTDDYFSLDKTYRTIFKDLATTGLDSSIFFGADQVLVFRNGSYVEPDQIDWDDYERNEDLYKQVPHVSGWFVEPDRGISPRVYAKTQLVPFAEGLPFVQHVPVLMDFISHVSGIIPYVPGKEQLVFDLNVRDQSVPFRFGPLICFESIYPRLSRASVRNGAEALVVITNDSWYEQTAGPRFHQLESVFRAVETRRWLIRCANHGISCFISPFGKIVEETQLARDAVLKREIRGAKGLTFYARFGDLFSWVMLVATVLLAFVERRQR